MKKLLLSLSLLALAGTAHAGDRFYAGMSTGMVSFKLDCSGSTDCDKNDTGFKAYAGMALNRILAIELDYFHFGGGSFKIGPTAGGRGTAEALAGDVALRFSPASAPTLSAVLRGGLAYVKNESTLYNGSMVEKDTNYRLAPYAGFGLEWALEPGWKLFGNADFTRAEMSSVKGTVQMLTIGLQGTLD